MKSSRIKRFWLRLWIDKNEFYIKDCIRHYCYFNKINYELWDLISIKVKTYRKKILVTITAQRPGIVIGKKAVTINGIKEYLTEQVDRPIKINIIDYDVWNHKGLYYQHAMVDRKNVKRKK